ncbi:serine-rich coiled-coil domain-containing protein 2 isoform X1 [Pelobates fuscus]|uniref:serine-rich coiled-coil domain-containing protein 2 isoform X1 n=1 Tax=Pelobates fuscus TaxID=191477 RepID=UPI002FE49BC4
MEEKIQVRASQGSKLPKFGASKPVGSLLQRPSSRTPAGLLGKTNFTRVEQHNDHDRPSTLSLNWSKSKCQQNGQISKDTSSDEKVHDKHFSHPYMAGDKDASRLAGTAKTAGKQNNVLMSRKEDLNENLVSGLPNAAKFTKSTIFGRTSCSTLNGCKTQVNGYYSSKPPVGLQRPRANSATVRNFSDKSTDNTKSLSRVTRSQSFSHSTQNPLFSSGPLTRSYSFTRDVELTRPYTTQHAPSRPAPKLNMLSRTSRQYELANGNESHIKSSFTRTFPARPSSGLKAPGLSDGSAAPLSLCYKMSRPSLLKPSRTQFQREIVLNGTRCSPDSLVTKKTEHLITKTGEEPSVQQQVDKKELDIDSYILYDKLDKKESIDACYSEDVDELSISSLSSSDKSEDFSDDFVDLEDGNKTVTAVESGNKILDTSPAEYSLNSLQHDNKYILTNTDDWLAHSETESSKSPYGKTRLSPDMDYRDHSSLELSPSDSSDGTYMWDEEGMEPIGSVHPCGSYESSEMNSLDILNNLDSCDLEDDDLMLDVDLPEDPPCDNGKGVENMSHLERTEQNLRQQQQAFWKRVPPRLNGQEQYHLINADHYHNGRGSTYLESPTEPESYASPSFYQPSPRSSQMMGLRENTVMLDEMTLRHMVQDCTSVKTQLLKLKRLLQQEDDLGSPQDLQRSVRSTPEPQEPEILLKTEDLLNEIRQLKEDALKKDETIKHLEHQLKTRCKCQKGSQDSKAEKAKKCDKYTQTTWRRTSPPILQCSSNILHSSDHHSEKLIIPEHTEDPSEHEEKMQFSPPCNKNGIDGNIFNVSENELSALLSTQLKIKDVEDNPKEVTREDETSASLTKAANSKDLGHQQLNSVFSAHLPVDTIKDPPSKLKVKKSSAGQVPRPKTLQLFKSKSPNSLVHQEVASSSASPSSYLPCKDSQKPTLTTSHCLVQSENGSQSVVQKSQQLTPIDCTAVRPPVHVPRDTVSGSLATLLDNTDSVKTVLNKPDTIPPKQCPPSQVGNSKLAPAGSSLFNHQAPAVEPSKPAVKQTLKASMLRPPGNFVSKLKKPVSPKLDAVPPQAVSHEHPKPTLKTSSIIPRPLSSKKEESIESSSPKKQSRLPQPNALRKQ